MILTPLKIQIAIIKAWYSIALKSVKYYAGLAVGINNSCLLKQARLLRKYVEILRNFTIVDSTIECSCCIEGDYTVLLNDLSETTEANIQFGCDTEGYMLFNGVGYPFTYYYDEPNSKVFLKFTTLINPSTELPYELNLEDVTFSDSCDFTTSTLSPIEEATIEPIENEPVTNNEWGNWDGNISIYEPNGTTLLVAPENPLPISVDIINNPELIVDEWNNNGVPGWLLIYSNNQFTMLTPFDQVDYSGYVVKFSQYEGGVNSSITNTIFIPQTFIPIGTRASTEIDIPDLFVGGKQAEGLITPSLPQPFITTNTPASVNLTILDSSFSTTQQSATMTIDLKGSAVFGATTQFFYYDSTLMFSHVGAYANAAALVLDFNNNNGQGFVMTYIGPSSTPGRFSFEIESPINGESYNGNDITVIYSAGIISPAPDSSIFSGGISTKPTSIIVSDTINGIIYTIISPLFNSTLDFVNDFNTNILGYTAAIASSNVVTITAPSSTGAAFNGTTITYSTTGPTYTVSNTYSGGVDTTECTYSLEIFDTGNTLFATIDNLTPTNYPSLADIAADINSNPLNTYLFYTEATLINELSIAYPDPFVLPQSLTCSTYNGYTCVLTITYTSAEYPTYTSDPGLIDGGINAYSPDYTISDTVTHRIPLLFTRLNNTYNYPNGSEIQNGLISDFNTNNTEGYTAQFISAGTEIPELPSTALNDFLTQLNTIGITNGESLVALIDSQLIGRYDAPLITTLPSNSNIINLLCNDIISDNIIPGLGAQAQLAPSYSRIILSSPPNQAENYNGKTFKIEKRTYTPAVYSFIVTGPSFSPSFKLSVNGIMIANVTLSGLLPASSIAASISSSINASGTGFTASVSGTTVDITAPPYTGGSYSNALVGLEVILGTVDIDGTTYLAGSSYILPTGFLGGLTALTPIRSVNFIGGINPIPTKRVRFTTPIQLTTAPVFGTGNWQYNGEILTFDLNFGEYTPNNSPLGYLGGIDPTVGSLIVEILNPDLSTYAILYIDGTPQNYLSRQSLVNIFNAANPLPVNFQISLLSGSSLAAFLSPTDSFSFFNDFKFRYSYNYVSDQYSDYTDITTTFDDGVDPTLTSYEGIFQIGDIGTFVNDNPCEATIAEQECLSNKQVSNIIQHINKLVR
jgi:hypothetical protein